MSDPDEERRQRECDSLAEFRRLKHHQHKRYPEPGDSRTASLPLNSHATSTESDHLRPSVLQSTYWLEKKPSQLMDFIIQWELRISQKVS